MQSHTAWEGTPTSALVVRVVFSRSCDFPGAQESQVRKASIRVATDVLGKVVRDVYLLVAVTLTWAGSHSSAPLERCIVLVVALDLLTYPCKVCHRQWSVFS